MLLILPVCPLMHEQLPFWEHIVFIHHEMLECPLTNLFSHYINLTTVKPRLSEVTVNVRTPLGRENLTSEKAGSCGLLREIGV
jgi:hypothetical protein